MSAIALEPYLPYVSPTAAPGRVERIQAIQGGEAQEIESVQPTQDRWDGRSVDPRLPTAPALPPDPLEGTPGRAYGQAARDLAIRGQALALEEGSRPAQPFQHDLFPAQPQLGRDEVLARYAGPYAAGFSGVPGQGGPEPRRAAADSEFAPAGQGRERWTHANGEGATPSDADAAQGEDGSAHAEYDARAAQHESEQDARPVGPEKTGADGKPLADADLRMLRQLEMRDAEVRAHEQAHLSAAGGLARGGATFSYQKGPDGRDYAIGGEVQIDTSPAETPQATIQKMQQVQAAALAPANPSSQDRAVASAARRAADVARRQVLMESLERQGQAQDLKQNVNRRHSAPSNENSAAAAGAEPVAAATRDAAPSVQRSADSGATGAASGAADSHASRNIAPASGRLTREDTPPVSPLVLHAARTYRSSISG